MVGDACRLQRVLKVAQERPIEVRLGALHEHNQIRPVQAACCFFQLCCPPCPLAPAQALPEGLETIVGSVAEVQVRHE